MNTRSSNKDAHPGLIIKPASRKSSETVASEKADKAEKLARLVTLKKAKIAKVAALENAMAIDDAEEAEDFAKPAAKPTKKVVPRKSSPEG